MEKLTSLGSSAPSPSPIPLEAAISSTAGALLPAFPLPPPPFFSIPLPEAGDSATGASAEFLAELEVSLSLMELSVSDDSVWTVMWRVLCTPRPLLLVRHMHLRVPLRNALTPNDCRISRPCSSFNPPTCSGQDGIRFTFDRHSRLLFFGYFFLTALQPMPTPLPLETQPPRDTRLALASLEPTAVGLESPLTKPLQAASKRVDAKGPGRNQTAEIAQS